MSSTSPSIATSAHDGPSSSRSLRLAVESATRAPSVHNTQPWRFRVSDVGTGGSIDLYADRSRSLPVIDPTGRQLQISCGVALLFLRVALRAADFDAVVDIRPDDDPDHLAHVVAVPGSRATAGEQALAAAILRRHSQRSAFQSRALEPELLTEFRRAAESEGAWLAVVHRRDDQITLTTLLSRADREEARDPDYGQELRTWLRTEPSPDGVLVQSLPPHVERHTDVDLRNFNPGRVGEQPAELPEQTPVDEHPALVVLGTDGDGAKDHLTAGMALGRLLLRATDSGVSASLLGQVMDLPGPRAALRDELNIVGEPQIVLRLGYGTSGSEAASGRRAVDEVLLP
jgi:hypothetical protein